MANKPTIEDVAKALQGVLATLRAAKPEDRTELDRRYAVLITSLEKVFAYFFTYIYTQEANK